MNTNTSEGIQDRIAVLRNEHAEFERQLAALPSSSDLGTCNIKKRKLRCKDEMRSLEQRLKLLNQPPADTAPSDERYTASAPTVQDQPVLAEAA